MAHLYTWEEAAELDIASVQGLYRSYVNETQVKLAGLFGFGRDLAVSAEGMYITTASGRRLLDFTGGFGVLTHGHNHPRILAARSRFQQEQRMEVHKTFLSPYVAALSHNIAQLLPEDLNVSYFCNSGSEAVEGAVKLAYKYHGGKRRYILHSDISFHGRLLGAGSLTTSTEVNFQFPRIPHVATFEYDNIASVRERVGEIRAQDGEPDIYAIIVEPFSASTLRGCSPAFLLELRELCTREGIVLILDEVYTGWGITGHLFSFMESGAVPDIVAMSKALGGGKASISGYTARDRLFRSAYDNRRYATLHSTTYNGFGEECATAIEAVNIAIEDDYPGRASRIHDRLYHGLRGLRERYPGFIREVRGRGALLGVVFQNDLNPWLRTAMSVIPAPLFRDPHLVPKLVASSVVSELYDTHGILAFFRSTEEVPLVVSPSLIVTDEEIDRFLDALDRTLALGKRALITRFLRGRFFARV